jgi:hypothetical protein
MSQNTSDARALRVPSFVSSLRLGFYIAVVIARTWLCVKDCPTWIFAFFQANSTLPLPLGFSHTRF